MEKQIKIEIYQGVIIRVTTNFEGSYQIIDKDCEEEFMVGDVYEPDEVLIDQEIFE